MVPGIRESLAFHPAVPELRQALSSIGIKSSGPQALLADRTRAWIMEPCDAQTRRDRVKELFALLTVASLKKVACYALLKPAGRSKQDLTVALAERFVPVPAKLLLAHGFKVLGDDPVGSGSFGIVYKVRQLSTKRVRAAKILSSDARPYAGEVDSLAVLRHRNVVRYYHDIPEPIPFVVTEWCGGGSLARRIYEGINQPEAIGYVATEVARGLAYLHGKRVFHHDLWAPNVLLLRNGEVRIADFGLARRPAGNHDDHGFRNRRFGDPSGDPGMASDVYMLGQTLMCMLNGKLKPSGQPDVPRGGPHRRFWDVVRASLDPDNPDSRPSARDILDAAKATFGEAALARGRRLLRTDRR